MYLKRFDRQAGSSCPRGVYSGSTTNQTARDARHKSGGMLRKTASLCLPVTPHSCISPYLPLRMISLHLPAKGDGATFLRGATNIITTSQGEQNTQLKALVAELVVLMNAYAADSAEDRAKTEYRGGPFLPRNREHWPRSLIALWDALIKVCLPSLTLKPSPTHLPLNLPLNLLSRCMRHGQRITRRG